VPRLQIRGSWYVLLRGEDDEVLVRSVELHDEAACGDLLRRIQRWATASERFERHAGTNGGHYFTLHDEAGNVLGRSATFVSSDACERTIEKVLAAARHVAAVAADDTPIPRV
jgi:hypothetical protein